MRGASIIVHRNPYVWDDLNESIKEKLNSPVPVRVYQSMSHALLETATALQNLFSQKRQYATSLASLGSHAEDMAVFLSRQGIKAISQNSASALEDLDEKKTLFWVFDRDDAITGQKYVPDTLLKQDSKIFRIFISHSLHLIDWPQLHLNEADIYILAHPSTGGAIAFLGRRTQAVSSLLCPTLDWSRFFLPNTNNRLLKSQATSTNGSSDNGFTKNLENKSWVLALESKSLAGSASLMSSISERIFDRALIYWKDLDSSAIRDLLIADHGIAPDDLDCLSLNRWLDTRLVAQFKARGWDSDIFRGLLIVSARVHSDSGFDQKLLATIEKLKKMSNLTHV